MNSSFFLLGHSDFFLLLNSRKCSASRKLTGWYEYINKWFDDENDELASLTQKRQFDSTSLALNDRQIAMSVMKCWGILCQLTFFDHR